jgi:hypothetical protein
MNNSKYISRFDAFRRTLADPKLYESDSISSADTKFNTQSGIKDTGVKSTASDIQDQINAILKTNAYDAEGNLNKEAWNRYVKTETKKALETANSIAKGETVPAVVKTVGAVLNVAAAPAQAFQAISAELLTPVNQFISENLSKLGVTGEIFQVGLTALNNADSAGSRTVIDHLTSATLSTLMGKGAAMFAKIIGISDTDSNSAAAAASIAKNITQTLGDPTLADKVNRIIFGTKEGTIAIYNYTSGLNAMIKRGDNSFATLLQTHQINLSKDFSVFYNNGALNVELLKKCAAASKNQKELSKYEDSLAAVLSAEVVGGQSKAEDTPETKSETAPQPTATQTPATNQTKPATPPAATPTKPTQPAANQTKPAAPTDTTQSAGASETVPDPAVYRSFLFTVSGIIFAKTVQKNQKTDEEIKKAIAEALEMSYQSAILFIANDKSSGLGITKETFEPIVDKAKNLKGVINGALDTLGDKTKPYSTKYGKTQIDLNLLLLNQSVGMATMQTSVGVLNQLDGSNFNAIVAFAPLFQLAATALLTAAGGALLTTLAKPLMEKLGETAKGLGDEFNKTGIAKTFKKENWKLLRFNDTIEAGDITKDFNGFIEKNIPQLRDVSLGYRKVLGSAAFRQVLGASFAALMLSKKNDELKGNIKDAASNAINDFMENYNSVKTLYGLQKELNSAFIKYMQESETKLKEELVKLKEKIKDPKNHAKFADILTDEFSDAKKGSITFKNKSVILSSIKDNFEKYAKVFGIDASGFDGTGVSLLTVLKNQADLSKTETVVFFKIQTFKYDTAGLETMNTAIFNENGFATSLNALGFNKQVNTAAVEIISQRANVKCSILYSLYLASLFTEVVKYSRYLISSQFLLRLADIINDHGSKSAEEIESMVTESKKFRIYEEDTKDADYDESTSTTGDFNIRRRGNRTAQIIEFLKDSKKVDAAFNSYKISPGNIAKIIDKTTVVNTLSSILGNDDTKVTQLKVEFDPIPFDFAASTADANTEVEAKGDVDLKPGNGFLRGLIFNGKDDPTPLMLNFGSLQFVTGESAIDSSKNKEFESTLNTAITFLKAGASGKELKIEARGLASAAWSKDRFDGLRPVKSANEVKTSNTSKNATKNIKLAIARAETFVAKFNDKKSGISISVNATKTHGHGLSVVRLKGTDIAEKAATLDRGILLIINTKGDAGSIGEDKIKAAMLNANTYDSSKLNQYLTNKLEGEESIRKYWRIANTDAIPTINDIFNMKSLYEAESDVKGLAIQKLAANAFGNTNAEGAINLQAVNEFKRAYVFSKSLEALKDAANIINRAASKSFLLSNEFIKITGASKLKGNRFSLTIEQTKAALEKDAISKILGSEKEKITTALASAETLYQDLFKSEKLEKTKVLIKEYMSEKKSELAKNETLFNYFIKTCTVTGSFNTFAKLSFDLDEAALLISIAYTANINEINKILSDSKLEGLPNKKLSEIKIQHDSGKLIEALRGPLMDENGWFGNFFKGLHNALRGPMTKELETNSMKEEAINTTIEKIKDSSKAGLNARGLSLAAANDTSVQSVLLYGLNSNKELTQILDKTKKTQEDKIKIVKIVLNGLRLALAFSKESNLPNEENWTKFIQDFEAEMRETQETPEVSTETGK